MPLFRHSTLSFSSNTPSVLLAVTLIQKVSEADYVTIFMTLELVCRLNLFLSGIKLFKVEKRYSEAKYLD